MAIQISGTTVIDNSRNIQNIGVATATILSTTNLVPTNVNSSGITTASRLGINTTSVTEQFQVGSGTTIVVIDSTGEVGIGTTNPTSKLHIVGADARFGGVTESVAAATTYSSGSAMVLELDARAGTAFTYTMPTNANIGIVSFKNLPAQTNRPSGTTITLIITQNSAGTGNTTITTGIGTNCFITGYENGVTVTGITTRALVGSASTITLSTTGNDVDFISFFVNYNGGTNTSPINYKVYAIKNGGFRAGTIGV